MRCLPVVQFATSGSLPRANMDGVLRSETEQNVAAYCVLGDVRFPLFRLWNSFEKII